MSLKVRDDRGARKIGGIIRLSNTILSTTAWPRVLLVQPPLQWMRAKMTCVHDQSAAFDTLHQPSGVHFDNLMSEVRYLGRHHVMNCPGVPRGVEWEERMLFDMTIMPKAGTGIEVRFWHVTAAESWKYISDVS